MNKVEVTTRTGQVFFVEVSPVSGVAPVALAEGEVVRSGIPEDTRERLRQGDRGLGPAGAPMGRDGAVLSKTEAMFSKAVGVIRSVSEEVSTGLLESHPRPSEVQLSLDLGFDAGGNVWIFKGGASASLRLLLKWQLPVEDGK